MSTEPVPSYSHFYAKSSDAAVLQRTRLTQLPMTPYTSSRQHCDAVPVVTLCCCRPPDDRVPIFTVNLVTQLPVMLCTFLQAVGTVTQLQMTPCLTGNSVTQFLAMTHFCGKHGDPTPSTLHFYRPYAHAIPRDATLIQGNNSDPIHSHGIFRTQHDNSSPSDATLLQARR